MATEIQEEYEKLGKKYRLPEFKDINSVFEISSIENTEFLLRGVIGKMAEKFDFYTKLLEGFLQPDASSLSSMHEIRFFSEDEKQKIYSLYKKLMGLNRGAVETELIQRESKEAGFILRAFNAWLSIKSELLEYVKKMEESWEKETGMEEELGYLG